MFKLYFVKFEFEFYYLGSTGKGTDIIPFPFPIPAIPAISFAQHPAALTQAANLIGW